MSVETQDPLDVLEHENDVSEQLIEHLAEAAIELKEGRGPPAGELAEGLRLLDQYRRLHSERVDRDLQTEARPVAMPTCHEHLDTITKDHGTEPDRIECARHALQEFTQGAPSGAARLAQALADLTEKEHGSVVYEGDYPLSCLRAELPAEAAARVTEAFRRTDVAVADLERHIVHFLERAPGAPAYGLSVRCGESGCRAVAGSRVVPSHDGHLALEVPPGWQAGHRPPLLGRDRTLRLRVDFFCPAHLKGGSTQPDATSAGTGIEGDRTGYPEASEGREPCDCCGPIPEDTR